MVLYQEHSRMKVIIKPQVESKKIKLMVLDCFGPQVQITSIEQLQKGWFNAVYKIVLLNPDMETYLRVAPSPAESLLSYEKDLMRTEVDVYHLLSSLTNIPLPEIYSYNFKHDLIDHDYIFISKIAGKPLDEIRPELTEDDLGAIQHDLGRYLGQIHAIRGTFFGLFNKPPISGPNTWRNAFLTMIDMLLNDAVRKEVALPLSVDAIHTAFNKHAAVLDEIKEPHLVHGDIWDPNIFIQRQEGQARVSGIIDCDRSFWGDPEAETFMLFHATPEFFTGYSHPLSDTPSAACRRLMYQLHLYLIMNIEAKGRFEGPEHLGWARKALEQALNRLVAWA